MPLDDNRYVCALCGARLDLDHNVIPTVAFEGRRPEPSWRVVAANGREVHRCRAHPREMESSAGMSQALGR
jgi:hypothetical protein